MSRRDQSSSILGRFAGGAVDCLVIVAPGASVVPVVNRSEVLVVACGFAFVVLDVRARRCRGAHARGPRSPGSFPPAPASGEETPARLTLSCGPRRDVAHAPFANQPTRASLGPRPRGSPNREHPQHSSRPPRQALDIRARGSDRRPARSPRLLRSECHRSVAPPHGRVPRGDLALRGRPPRA